VVETLGFLIVLLLVLDLLVAAVRSSLLNARQPYLLEQREHNPEGVDRTLRLLDRPRLRVSLRLAAVTLHYLLAGSVWGMLYSATQGSLTIAGEVAIVLVVALLILAIEFGIEGLILPQAEKWAVRFSMPGALIDGLVSPLSTLLMPLLGSPTMLRRRLSPVTEDELKNWVEEGPLQGNLEQGERKMIYSIFHFGDTLAREIMVPRIDITALDVTTPLQEAVPVLLQSGHSRVPVFDGTIDNVIGMLYAKDLLRMLHEGQEPPAMRDLLRPAYFIPEAKKVDDLLTEMRQRRVHMAIVVDEYGGVAGLVTLEDIVEEIVGEIRDEYDALEEQPYQKVGEDEYIFQGRIDLDDFNEVMGCELERDIADTLGGFVYNRMGHVPIEGETLVENDLHLTVEQVSGRRIRKVRARRLLREGAPKDEIHDE